MQDQARPSRRTLEQMQTAGVASRHRAGGLVDVAARPFVAFLRPCRSICSSFSVVVYPAPRSSCSASVTERTVLDHAATRAESPVPPRFVAAV